MNGLWFTNISATFLLCVILAGVLIPQILLIAYRRNLFDEPDERKIHKAAVPRLGGIAFTLVIFFSLAFVLGMNLLFGYYEIVDRLEEEMTILIFAFCSILLLYIVGIADDLIGVRYRAKFFVQIVCGLMLITGGLSMTDFHGFLWLDNVPMWFGIPVTLFVIVFIINAINLIDGLDGLASGLCSVAFVTYAYTFLKMDMYLYAAIAIANLGVLLPFFYYNVFGKAENHTKIFMGDTGSMTVGISICILTLKILGSVPAGTADFPNPFVIAFAPLIIPCFDVIRVYMHRVRNGKNPFLPDKNHIHHKLLAIGLNRYVTMLSIVSASLILVVINCIASMYVNVNILVIINVVLVTVFNIWLTKRGGGRSEIKTE